MIGRTTWTAFFPTTILIRYNSMKIKDMIKMCLQNLLRRKSRTILTVLGVVVGCCAIVTMLSIGIGVQNSQQIMLESMGDLTLIQVYSGGSNSKLDDEALRKFQNIPNVDVAVGKTRLENIGMEIYSEDKRYKANWAEVVGVNGDAMEKFGFELIDGSFPKQKFQVLAGQYTAYNFMDTQRPEGSNMIDRWSYMYQYNPDTDQYEYNENPDNIPDPYIDLNGATLTLEMYSYDDYEKKYYQDVTVTGILKQDYNKDYATSEGFIFLTSDIQSLTKMIFPTSTQKQSYSEIYVKAKDISDVAEVEKEIKKLGYSTYSMESIREPLEKEARQQQMMFGGLGAVSLFVAALGITNTMIMSISERTREIGVMKALGCFLGNIRTIFLMEAGFIGLIGGIIGALLSYLISFIMNLVKTEVQIESFQQFWTLFSPANIAMVMDPANSPTSIVPLWLAGFAIVFSIIIGLCSGFYPANKAVHISALEAIKRE